MCRFTLVCQNRMYELRAENEKDKKNWIEVLTYLIAKAEKEEYSPLRRTSEQAPESEKLVEDTNDIVPKSQTTQNMLDPAFSSSQYQLIHIFHLLNV